MEKETMTRKRKIHKFAFKERGLMMSFDISEIKAFFIALKGGGAIGFGRN